MYVQASDCYLRRCISSLFQTLQEVGQCCHSVFPECSQRYDKCLFMAACLKMAYKVFYSSSGGWGAWGVPAVWASSPLCHLMSPPPLMSSACILQSLPGVSEHLLIDHFEMTRGQFEGSLWVNNALLWVSTEAAALQSKLTCTALN